MSPWVTILKVLFIAPHFPRPALTPAAFLCSSVRPRKLSFLVYGTVLISLFYHLELYLPRHWGPRQLSPTVGLLIYRASLQLIQALWVHCGVLLQMHHHQIKTTPRGLKGVGQGSRAGQRPKRTMESPWL